MSAAAAKRRMITYGELASQMQSIELQPHDMMLWEIIGSVAADEENAGRGLLSVVVVHKHGDMAPGPGFFELAKYFGRDTRDKTACFIAEVNKVHRYWSVLHPKKTTELS
jgi:hypothetical protein